MINCSYNNCSFIECLPGSVPHTASLYIVGDFSFRMCMYMWSVSVHFFIYLCAHMCGYLHVKVRGWCFLLCLLYLLRQGLSPNPELTNSAGLTSQLALGTSRPFSWVLGLQMGCHTHPSFIWTLGSKFWYSFFSNKNRMNPAIFPAPCVFYV